jgi:hypothetical protein
MKRQNWVHKSPIKPQDDWITTGFNHFNIRSQEYGYIVKWLSGSIYTLKASEKGTLDLIPRFS